MSVHFPRIIPAELLARYNTAYNIHPSLLPYCRGTWPVFWTLWEQAPAGATLHVMTESVDKGPIVHQARIDYLPSESPREVFLQVRALERDMLTYYWDDITRGVQLEAEPQSGKGSFHTTDELNALAGRLFDQEALKQMNGHDALRLLRCLTLPGLTVPRALIDQRICSVIIQDKDN